MKARENEKRREITAKSLIKDLQSLKLHILRRGKGDREGTNNTKIGCFPQKKLLDFLDFVLFSLNMGSFLYV